MIKDSKKMFFILVNYNGYSDTVECIKSIISTNKSYDIKIIVIDNCSKERKIENLNNVFPEVELILEDNNLGFSAANNIGIKKACLENADYIVLVNNDTVFLESTIDEIYMSFNRFKEADVITGKIAFWGNKNKLWYGGGEFLKKKGNATHLGFMHDIDDPKYNQTKEISFCTGCLMCIKADTVKKYGYLAEDYFLYSEDTEYSLRVLKEGGSILYCPNIALYHKVSASTGQYSAVSQYYMVRNRLYLISVYLRGTSRFIAYFNTMIDLSKDILRKRGQIKHYKHAIFDFFRGQRGKILIQ